MVKWSTYCLSASVRWALAQFARPGNQRAIGCAVRALEPCLPEKDRVIRDDNMKNSRLQIEQRMMAGDTFVLEDFPLETVAALCDQHNYRWTFCDESNGKTSLRFVLRPGRKLTVNPVGKKQ